MDATPIAETFAKQLLWALYRLDAPIQQMDVVISGLPDGETKRQLVLNLGAVMDTVLSELLVPLYVAHPQLGCSSESGPWLRDAP